MLSNSDASCLRSSGMLYFAWISKFNLLYRGTLLDFLPQAYVQQLESSRLKLTQLEQELQRARQQVRLGPSLELCMQLCIKLSFI